MSIVFWNGVYVKEEDVTVSFHDRGYYFGDGIYEVIRFYNKKLFCTEDHIERFFEGLSTLHLSIPYNKKELIYFLNNLVSRNPFDSGSLYLQLTRGVMPRNHLYGTQKLKPQILAYVSPIDQRPLEIMHKGIAVILEKDIRWEWCNLKTLNLLANVTLKNKAHQLGAGEAILYRSNQGKITVTEATTNNVFVVKNGSLYTHPATNLVLHGITRKVVLKLARQLDIPIYEETFDTAFLLEGDEVFTTGTISEITPVVSVLNDTASSSILIGKGERGVITKLLQKAYTALINETCPSKSK